MQWFGPRPFAPACEPEMHVPTPVGLECEHCEEVFVDGDEGYLIPVIRSDQIAAVMNADGVLEKIEHVYMAHHAECNLVGVIGRARCILTHGSRGVCPHDVERDPPGMSKRAAARLAESLYQEQRLGRLTPQRKTELLERYFPAEGRRN